MRLTNEGQQSAHTRDLCHSEVSYISAIGSIAKIRRVMAETEQQTNAQPRLLQTALDQRANSSISATIEETSYVEQQQDRTFFVTDAEKENQENQI